MDKSLKILFAVAAINFVVFGFVCFMIGGNAFQGGKIVNGRYYVSGRPFYTAVSKDIYESNQLKSVCRRPSLFQELFSPDSAGQQRGADQRALSFVKDGRYYMDDHSRHKEVSKNVYYFGYAHTILSAGLIVSVIGLAFANELIKIRKSYSDKI